mmetsp:Transcript_41390/g.79304  ORF Transcript_41390/g.79304 Transcript_41390/m.79304 type:complete len:547 (-) Transcript_41390:36-1676(-)
MATRNTCRPRLTFARIWALWSHLPLLLFQGQLCCGLYDPINKIQSARLYGNIDDFAYYFVDLQVGTPPQRVSVILDTGSGIHAFPCAGCGHCGKHIDPAFDFSKSTTAAWIGCAQGQCTSSCDKGHCSYHQGYTEGSSIRGYWFNDYVRLGDSIQRNPPVMTKMGCHQNEDNLFYTQKANGIVGVGPGRRTLFDSLFKDSQHVQSDIFSICLAEWGGQLVVGGFNKSYHTSPIQRIRMINTGYYGVELTGMRINGQMLSGRWGSAMIDSGTTYTYMAAAPYHSLKDAIQSHCKSSGKCGTARGSCWSVSRSLGLVGFPEVEVIFGAVVTLWVPKAYLYRKSKSNEWCYAFENDGANANTVLGASWMLHKEVIFDMHAGQIGIANAQCPEYTERPPHPWGNKSTVQPARFPGKTTFEQQPSGLGKKPSQGRGTTKIFAVVGVLLTCALVGGFACVLYRKGQSRHARLDDDVEESGVPPQIVGNVHDKEALANADDFVIGGEDEDPEELLGEEAEAFANYVDGLELPPDGPTGSVATAPLNHQVGTTF